MFTSLIRRGLVVSFVAMLVAPLGCGGDSSMADVSGTVTYNTVPIERGAISFYPAEGDAPTAGGEIIKGQYRVAQMVPGKKRVQITIQPPPETGAARGKNRAGSEEKRHSREPEAAKRPLPDESQGNNQIVEIAAGKQTRDFSLGSTR
jgi:hypothetical protein